MWRQLWVELSVKHSDESPFSSYHIYSYLQIHIQEERPVVWKTILTEYFTQLNEFSRHVLSFHVITIKATQPSHIIHCDNDVQLFLKHINEHKVLVLVVLTMAELSCESIKHRPPSIIHNDIHNVISKLLSFNKQLWRENSLNSPNIYGKIRHCFGLNRYLLSKNFEQINQIYKCLKDVCETQLRKMSFLKGYLNMDRFTPSEQNDLKKLMQFEAM